ncbi:hypothetical protein ABZP36_002379 [Zizania latifolia]
MNEKASVSKELNAKHKKMHLDYKTGAYFDYGNHTEKVRLRWYEVTDNDVMRRELLRETLQSPQLQLVLHVDCSCDERSIWIVILLFTCEK